VLAGNRVDKLHKERQPHREEESVMKNKLSALIELVKHLHEACLDEAIESLEKMKEEAEREEEGKPPDCPHCRGERVVRNGRWKGKQQYLCREWGKSFTGTTGTAFYYSHSGEAVWKQVIRDTVKGIPLEETARNLGISRETAFNMRLWPYKFLLYCAVPRKKVNDTFRYMLI
jgi:transposase-like protein